MTVRLPTSCVQLMKTMLQVDKCSHQGAASINHETINVKQ